ncbi:MAG TPA: helix-turn-helix domain-containing protein [Rhizomicrobium sp.]|nr:helix-turn-helix domain-containing protein [Rhizomicrobium sp.]
MFRASAATLKEAPAHLAAKAVRPRKLTISEIAAERKIGVVLNISRGKTIFNDGEEAVYSYKVIEGAVRLSKIMIDGRRQIAEFALPGDMFGFEYGESYALSAEAVTPVTVIRYHRSHIENLGEEFSEVRRELMAHLRNGWTSAQAHLVMLGRQTAKERVAAFLVALANHRGVVENQSLELPMGRQDIADYLGLTIETVCRTLTEFKNTGVLSVPDRHRVIIRDFVELESLAQGDGDED